MESNFLVHSKKYRNLYGILFQHHDARVIASGAYEDEMKEMICEVGQQVTLKATTFMPFKIPIC